jgi:hypothetical protein
MFYLFQTITLRFLFFITIIMQLLFLISAMSKSEANRPNVRRWRNSTDSAREAMVKRIDSREFNSVPTEKPSCLRFSSDFVLGASNYSSDAETRRQQRESTFAFGFIANDTSIISQPSISSTHANGATESNVSRPRTVILDNPNSFPPEHAPEAAS